MNRAGDYDFSVSNEMLLELCKQQDQDALRVLLQRHERPVYNLLFRMLSNHDDAEEALAEVFVKVWRAAATFKGDSKFTTWLFRIAANTARDCLRSRMVRPEVSLEDVVVNEAEAANTTNCRTPSPESAAIDADDRARVIRAMQNLSEEDRLLVSLYHFQELDYDEIAKITNIPTGNLKVKLFRARQRLKSLCAEQEKDGGENEMRGNTTEPSGLRQGAADWS